MSENIRIIIKCVIDHVVYNFHCPAPRIISIDTHTVSLLTTGLLVTLYYVLFNNILKIITDPCHLRMFL